MILVLVIGSFAGCNSNDGKDDDKSEENPRILTVLLDSNDGWVRNFNPFATNYHQFVNGFTHEHLVLFDTMNENKEHMWLAEDIISEDDHKTLIVKVRQGIKWSDGQDFNADDVVFSFTYSKDHPSIDRSGEWGEEGKIQSVEKVDNYTVKIVMREANRFHRQDIFLQNDGTRTYLVKS